MLLTLLYTKVMSTIDYMLYAVYTLTHTLYDTIYATLLYTNIRDLAACVLKMYYILDLHSHVTVYGHLRFRCLGFEALRPHAP